MTIWSLLISSYNIIVIKPLRLCILYYRVFNQSTTSRTNQLKIFTVIIKALLFSFEVVYTRVHEADSDGEADYTILFDTPNRKYLCYNHDSRKKSNIYTTHTTYTNRSNLISIRFIQTCLFIYLLYQQSRLRGLEKISNHCNNESANWFFEWRETVRMTKAITFMPQSVHHKPSSKDKGKSVAAPPPMQKRIWHLLRLDHQTASP